MGLFQLIVSIGLTILLVIGSCCSSEDLENKEESVGELNSLNPSQPAKTEQLQDAAEDSHVRKNFEDSDTTRSKTPPDLQEELRNQDEDAAAAGMHTEDHQAESTSLKNDFEGESSVDSQGSKETRKSARLVLHAFGSVDTDDEDSTESQSDAKEEVWTEQTEDGTEQKRSSGRRFFSLMNLIKFLLNPVIEEFQEMEKSSTGQEAAAATAAAATDSNNHSEVAGVSTGNSSDVGEQEKKNGTESGKKTKFQCAGRNITENTTAVVRIVNSTVLLELLSFDKNHSASDCVLVMFYAPWCHFCAATAPHYNAIARAFPQLEVLAVDTVHFSNLNARFGTVAVPNIMLFHQSRSAVRFNHTERYFDTLLQFITNTTGLKANISVELSPEDYEGPLSSTPTEETDYLLWFAWFFIVVCSGHIFISSQVGQRAIERVMVLWMEHQHQHIE